MRRLLVPNGSSCLSYVWPLSPQSSWCEAWTVTHDNCNDSVVSGHRGGNVLKITRYFMKIIADLYLEIYWVTWKRKKEKGYDISSSLWKIEAILHALEPHTTLVYSMSTLPECQRVWGQMRVNFQSHRNARRDCAAKLGEPSPQRNSASIPSGLPH